MSGGGFLGTGIGGDSGFLGTGLFGNNKSIKARGFEMSNALKNYENEALKRQAAIASGQAPSIAQMAMNQNVDQANRATMAMAASARGSSNPLLAQREAIRANQEANLQAAQQGAMMAEEERRGADAFLVNQANAQRGIASSVAMNNASNVQKQQASNTQALSGIGSAMMMSDEREKKNVEDTSGIAKGIADFVKHLKPSEYEYKDEENGTGKKVGIMAQDLEKSKIGKTMVDETPDGKKVVDTNKAIGVLLASVAELNKKLDKVSKK